MARARPGTLQSLRAAATSWRFGAVTLLSLSSGAPLGLVLTGVPAWLAMSGVDIKTIGLLTLAQAPYAFKFLWSPLLDRFRPPFLGRKRGWILVWQLALAALVGLLAERGTSPAVGAVAALTLLIAFASASQDIAIDAYAVESLRPAEQGLAAGSRTALYRAGMWIAGNISITVAPFLGWSVTLACQAALYLALAPLTVLAPEPESEITPPRTLRDAVWGPFVGFFTRARALEITAFLVLYKLADNLALALVRPFLIEQGYSALDVGVASGTISLLGMTGGTFAGGVLTVTLGLGRALWIFGALQAFAGLGYALVASAPVVRPLMYAAVGVEAVTAGMAVGALEVLLLRLTDKRFSATQFALLTSIFAVGRTIAGPIAGFLVDALGWRDFFVFTMFCAAPGLLLLQRFAPLGAREVREERLDPPGRERPPLSLAGVAGRGALWGVAAALGGALASAGLRVLKVTRAGGRADPGAALAHVLCPADLEGALGLAGLLVLGAVVGFGAAAYTTARRGVARASPPLNAGARR